MEEIEEWLLKDIVEKERGPVVYVSFSENVRKSCYDISARNLNIIKNPSVLRFIEKNKF